MDQFCIKYKRKGFNYYTDYMGRYFDQIATRFGYRLVLNPKHTEAMCLCYPDETKWMTCVSDMFQSITYTQMEKLADLFATHFKTEAMVDVLPEKPITVGYPFLFSRTACAYNEPPFLIEGETILELSIRPDICNPFEPFVVDIKQAKAFFIAHATGCAQERGEAPLLIIPPAVPCNYIYLYWHHFADTENG